MAVALYWTVPYFVCAGKAIAAAAPPIIKGVTLAVKVVSVAETAMDTHQVIQDPELSTLEKTHRVATNIACIGLQTADFTGTLGALSDSTHLAVKVGLVGSDTARFLSKKSTQDDFDMRDLLDLTAIICFRAADASGLATSKFPDVYDFLKGPTEELQAGSILIGNRDKILAALKTIKSWIFFQRQQNPTLSPEEKYSKEIEEVLKASSIEEFAEIPDLFSQDEELATWVCPIRKKPIRFVAIIANAPAGNPIWYEKSAICNWIQEKPRTPPPLWPSKISIRERKIIPCEAIQEKINLRLKLLFDGMQEYRELFTKRETNS